MKLSRKVIIIITTILVLLIGGGVTFAINTPAARAERQLNFGNKYLQEGKYQEAILAFQKVIKIEPKNIPARLGLGKAYIATEEFDKAEAVLKEVIGIDSNNIPAREELFKIYVKQGNSDAANALLQEIIQIDPNIDIKQMKSDLETNKTASVTKSENDNLSSSDAQNTKESDLTERMNMIIYTPGVLEESKSRYGSGSTIKRTACYLDTSKNIAYFGEVQLDGSENYNVVKLHNPNFIPISEVPVNNSKDNYKKVKELVAKYNATKVIKEGNFYHVVIIEGNDFGGDLVKTGIELNSITFVDK